jgi:hypothetical protein
MSPRSPEDRGYLRRFSICNIVCQRNAGLTRTYRHHNRFGSCSNRCSHCRPARLIQPAQSRMRPVWKSKAAPTPSINFVSKSGIPSGMVIAEPESISMSRAPCRASTTPCTPATHMHIYLYPFRAPCRRVARCARALSLPRRAIFFRFSLELLCASARPGPS